MVGYRGTGDATGPAGLPVGTGDATGLAVVVVACWPDVAALALHALTSAVPARALGPGF
jgi:hypothetical protein